MPRPICSWWPFPVARVTDRLVERTSQLPAASFPQMTMRPEKQDSAYGTGRELAAGILTLRGYLCARFFFDKDSSPMLL
jgi:hypothetical protein